MTTIAGILAVLLALGVIETLLHRRILRRLPVRVHVNGTRGQTRVVRLIAAGLPGGGKRVGSKTAGSAAAGAGPAGEDSPLDRPDQPRRVVQTSLHRRAG